MSDRRGAKSGEDAALIVNGWTIYAHPLLLDQVDKLVDAAAEENDPQGGSTKVLAWLRQAIFHDVPQNPNDEFYRQGHTMGKSNTHWFRDKYAGRFRLFFRFDSRAKTIVFAWVNDQQTLRTRGAKNDAYAVFQKMLAKGKPPTSWKELLAQASAEEATDRLRQGRQKSLPKTSSD